MRNRPSTSVGSSHPRRNRALGVGVVVGLAGLGVLVPTIASGSARNTVGSGAAAQAVQRPFLASLSGAAEVPGPGDPDGTGAAAVTIDPTTGEICADLRVANVAPITAAHIHRGGPGVAGPVVVPLNAPNPTSATCVMAAPALATEIATTPAGFYVNVHNAEFPGGAVRGQLSVGTTTSGSIQLLPEPLRAYDSRTGSQGVVAAGTTRTVSLGTGTTGAGATQIAVPPGAIAAMVRLTITDTVGAGWVKMYSAALTAEPATAAANWSQPNQILGSDATVAVDAEGRIKITAGFGSTHVVIDVVGFVF
jgi:hypothetical protein